MRCFRVPSPSMLKGMNLLSTFRWAPSLALCAALVACASTAELEPPTVIRARAPQGYEKTIASYFAFRIRGPQNNAEVNVGRPEPGDCPLDWYITSQRGWVVPVVYATRTGEPTGKETIYIETKQYYFWFLQDTIAGVTSRMEVCPGATSSPWAQPSAVAEGSLPAPAPLPTKPDAQSREGVDTSEPSKGGRTLGRARVAGGQKDVTASKAKKTGKSSGKVRPAVKKAGTSRQRVESERK